MIAPHGRERPQAAVATPRRMLDRMTHWTALTMSSFFWDLKQKIKARKAAKIIGASPTMRPITLKRLF